MREYRDYSGNHRSLSGESPEYPDDIDEVGKADRATKVTGGRLSRAAKPDLREPQV